MQLETVTLDSFNAVPSDSQHDGIRIRQSGIARVLWRKLDKVVPASEVIPDGVAIYKD